MKHWVTDPKSKDVSIYGWRPCRTPRAIQLPWQNHHHEPYWDGDVAEARRQAEGQTNMSNQPPKGAVEMTKEQAANYVAKVKAGLPTNGGRPVDTSVAVTSAAKAAEKEAKQEPSFTIINPPLGVYSPSEPAETLRGIVLGMQIDTVTRAAFYVVQLTEACPSVEHHEDDAEAMGDEPGPVGHHVAVYDAPSLVALRSLPASWSADGALCTGASEVIIAPYRRNPYGCYSYVVQARHLQAPKDVRKPGFASQPDLPPPGDAVGADGQFLAERMIHQDPWRKPPESHEEG